MSILIKGMEMPRSCMNCIFCGFAGANCELDLCQITGNAQKHIPYSKMPDCPLVEVPPHGDLIDKDETMNEILEERGEDNACWFAGIVNDMPAIICADKDGET